MPFIKGQSGNPNGRGKKPQAKKLPHNLAESPILLESPIDRSNDPSNENNVIEQKTGFCVSPLSGSVIPGGRSGGGGRPKNAGSSVREWGNSFNAQGMSRKELIAMATDDSLPWAKQNAALRMLRSNEDPDMVEFEEWLSGKKSLLTLRDEGRETRLIKSATVKFIPQKGGDPIEERKLELHDRGLKESDWMVANTDGKATQRVEVIGPPVINLTINIPGMRYLPPTIPTTPALPAGAA